MQVVGFVLVVAAYLDFNENKERSSCVVMAMMRECCRRWWLWVKGSDGIKANYMASKWGM